MDKKELIEQIEKIRDKHYSRLVEACDSNEGIETIQYWVGYVDALERIIKLLEDSNGQEKRSGSN